MLNSKLSNFLAHKAFGLAALLALTSAAQTQAQPASFADIVAKTESAVVSVRTTEKVSAQQLNPFNPFNPFGQRPRPAPRQSQPDEEVPRGVGSGFFISSDGYLLTNHHVVDGASEIYINLSDKRELKAKLIGSDERTDVALLKVEGANFPRLAIGSPDALRKGDWVIAIGSPFGLDSTVTVGVVSAKKRDTGDLLPLLQTDVAINPGNSGGPLLNVKGEVVGINSQIFTRSGGYQGISFSIPIDEAVRVSDNLKANGRVSRGKIGIGIESVSKEMAEQLGLGASRGALVTQLEPGGPGEKAGIKTGEIITKVNGVELQGGQDLQRNVFVNKPGTQISLEVVARDGKRRTVSVTLAELDPAPSAASGGKDNETTLGLSLKDLSAAQLREAGVDNGVLVANVTGVAAGAGLRRGDIIMALGRTEVSKAAQLEQLIAQANKTRPLLFLVAREGRAMWLAVRPK